MTLIVKQKILIVDDSVVVRGLLRQLIEAESDMEVIATAINGREGVLQYKNTKPDVVLMDIEMPEMDGIEALNEILTINKKARVIMCSSLTKKGTVMTFKALEQGAFDCISKPTTTSIDRGDDFKDNLIRLLRETKKESLIQTTPTGRVQKKHYELQSYSPHFQGALARVLAIGSSTGGPAVLTEILRQLPVLEIPIFITQHMPKGFTKILAETLSRNTNHKVIEAEDGMHVKGGEVYVAAGGKHMTLKNTTIGITIRLDDGPAVSFCKPSVNVMLDSILDCYQQNIITAILTGMGDDGLAACQKITQKSDKNILITQDKTTSTVWGMPAAVVQAGIAHGIFPMSNIAPAISKLVKGQRP